LQFALVTVYTVKPTEEQAAAYQKAFDHFNKTLFGGQLPFAYLNFSRHAGAKGFFAAERWGKPTATKATMHEISLNPDLLREPPVEYYGTLVHEMCHHWQQCFGSPSRNGYHNLEWARKMFEVGLTPTDTGQPGGKLTGQKVTHMIEPDGNFMRDFKKLPKEALLPWVSGGLAGEEKPKKPKPPRKIKLTCPVCKVSVWIMAEDEGHQILCEECSDYFLTKEELQERKEDENDD
jgi:hypothetical protein